MVTSDKNEKQEYLESLARTKGMTIEKIVELAGCSRRYATQVVYPIWRRLGRKTPGIGRPRELGDVVQCTVVLDKRHAAFAAKQQNFSKWIRDRIDEAIQQARKPNEETKMSTKGNAKSASKSSAKSTKSGCKTGKK